MTSIYPLNLHDSEPKPYSKSPIRDIFSGLNTSSDNIQPERYQNPPYPQQNPQTYHTYEPHYRREYRRDFENESLKEVYELKEEFRALARKQEQILKWLDNVYNSDSTRLEVRKDLLVEKPKIQAPQENEIQAQVTQENQEVQKPGRKNVKTVLKECCRLGTRGNLINLVLILASALLTVLTVKEIKNMFSTKKAKIEV